MISDKLSNAISKQLNFEMYSAYIYLAMSIACDRMKLPGASHWFDIQSQEELVHTAGLRMYLQAHNAEVELFPVEKPSSGWNSLSDIFTAALAHEQGVTARINNLAALALQEKDFATLSFLNFYLSEQVEEEFNVQNIIDKLSLAGNSPEAIMQIDSALNSRVIGLAMPGAPGNPPGKI